MKNISAKAALVVLFVLGVLTYNNAIKNPFMLDDYSFFGMNAKQPLLSFFVPNRNETMGLESARMERTYYRPLAHVIPLVCHRMFGAQPMGYHLVNAFLLWLAACMVFVFLRSWRLGPAHGFPDGKDGDLLAFCVSALFLVHPVSGIMVNYITASVFAAQVGLMLAVLICLLGADRGGWKIEDRRGKIENRKEKIEKKSQEQEDVVGAANHYSGKNVVNRIFGRMFSIRPFFFSSFSIFHPPFSIFFSIIFFTLALMCHETAIMLPLYAALALKLDHSWRDVLRRIWPLLLVTAVYLMFRSYASPFSRSILYSFSILELSLPEKAATVIKLLSWYFQKLFFPWDIFLMWSTPFVRGGAWLWIVPFAGLVSAGLAILFLKARQNVLTVFVLWFALGLAPLAAGAFVTPYLGGLIEPHWFVFGSIGFFGAATLVSYKIIPRRWRAAVFCAVIGILMMFSWSNNRLWSQEKAYYQAWLKEAPHFKAVHYFLGLTYQRQGEHELAYAHFEQSLLGRYKDWMVYLELGLIDLKRGQWERAREHLNKAYSLEQENSGILNAMGAFAYRTGDITAAREFWERSIVRNPYNLEPRMNLAAYYVRMSQPQEAMAIYRDILRISPGFMPAEKGLGRLERQGVR